MSLLSAASSNAQEVDYLLLALLLVSAAVLALVFGLMLLFVVKYRQDSPIDRGSLRKKTWRIETAWTAATLVAFFGLFIWGADLYVRQEQPPGGALKIYVVAKQWMWKAEHEGGQREINAVHLPIGRPIQLVMTSEDVIHSFFVPAFRLKHDVLPQRYETVWFTAQIPGTFHLFCTQFCGTDHAVMGGSIVAMREPDYEAWLAQNGPAETLADAGRTLFMRNGCSGCHGGQGVGGQQAGSTVRAPPLIGLYGSPVALADGSVVTADDRYIRDQMLMPQTERVKGYDPVMPNFSGVIGEEDVLSIVAYIKSLAPEKQL